MPNASNSVVSAHANPMSSDANVTNAWLDTTDTLTANCAPVMELSVISNLVNAFAHQTPSRQHATLANHSLTPTILNSDAWNVIATPEVCPTKPTVDAMKILASADAVTTLVVCDATNASLATMDSLIALNALATLEEAHQTPATEKLGTVSARTTLKANSATDAKLTLSTLMLPTHLDALSASALECLILVTSHNTHKLKSTTWKSGE
jgi:hypothetical protein